MRTSSSISFFTRHFGIAFGIVLWFQGIGLSQEVNPTRQLSGNPSGVSVLENAGASITQPRLAESQAGNAAVPSYASTGVEDSQALQQPAAFEPFQVFVSQANAFAHCGPSDDYYRTDPLRFGQTLEVYTETVDGWLGIRPPEDSFCWLPAETVELDRSGEVGLVIEDRTVSWIGTQLGRARQYRWQVQLAKGEQVTVIGRREREGADGPQLWYRIVPPSGEYRWVHRDSVVESTEALVAIAQRNANGLATTQQTDSSYESTNRFMRQTAAGNFGTGNPVLQAQEPIGSGVRQTGVERSVDPNTGSPNSEDRSEAMPQTAMDVFREEGLLASLEFMTRPKIQDIGAQQSQPQTLLSSTGSVDSLRQAPQSNLVADDSNWVSGQSRGRRNPRYADVSGATGLPAQGDGFEPSFHRDFAESTVMQVASTVVDPAVVASRVAELNRRVLNANVDQLNLLLSRLMAAQATSEEIAVVAQAAEQLASRAASSVDQERAQMVVETANRYRRVALRRDGGVTTAGVQETTSGSWGASQPSVVNPVGSANPVAMRAPGDVMRQEGYLVQVYSARTNSPPFALTDSAGRTVAYLSPMPGVNLRTHLNQQIGVVGSLSSLEGMDTPHLMVTQAIRVSR